MRFKTFQLMWFFLVVPAYLMCYKQFSTPENSAAWGLVYLTAYIIADMLNPILYKKRLPSEQQEEASKAYNTLYKLGL